MDQNSDEVRVRDLIRSGTLESRGVLGARLCERIGCRAWARPNVAISNRFYRKYGVDDPWDPASPHQGKTIGLGPVGLRLTEPRRQVAPHLKPKEPARKKKLAQKAHDPLARWRKKPTPSASPSPSPPPEPPPPPERPNPFGRSASHGLRGKLPVRPDLDRDDTTPPSDGVDSPMGSPTSPSGLPGPRIPGPPGRSRRSRSGGARVRMRGQHIKSEAPTVIGGAPEPEPAAPTPEPTAPPASRNGPESPERRMPKTSMGMDDLFAAAGEAGRMRVGRRRPASSPETDSSEE